jgi:hypothetical protein
VISTTLAEEKEGDCGGEKISTDTERDGERFGPEDIAALAKAAGCGGSKP